MTAATESGAEHLRREIVVIEDEACPEQLVERGNEDEQIRRIVRVNDIEARSEEHQERQRKARDEGVAVLPDESEDARDGAGAG